MSTNTHAPTRFRQTIAGAWQLDPARSRVEFRVPNFWGLASVEGHFEDYRGQLELTAEPAVELTIEATSLETGNPKRDRHLRSPAFFAAETHPQVRFVSDEVSVHGATLQVRGRLSARGASIPLELEAKLRHVDGELEIEAATTAPHRELGMKFSPLRMIGPRSHLKVTGYLLPA
jgi:polyisoprenoid-binding protein YceI